MLRIGDTSSASAKRFIRRYERRLDKESAARAGSVPWIMCLDATVMGHVTRFPRRATDIYADVLHDYGSLNERLFYASLARLRDAKRVERTDDGYRRRR